jgi:hypothetical protein
MANSDLIWPSVTTLTGPVGIGATVLADSGLNITSAKDADFLNAIVLGAGATGQYKRYLNFINYADNTTAWRLGANRTNDFIIYDNTSGIHALLASSPADGGTLTLNANGTAAVRINYDTDVGAATGGLKVYGGTTTPVEWFRVDSGGIAGYVGKPFVTYSPDNTKSFSLAVSDGSVASFTGPAGGIISLKTSTYGGALYVRTYETITGALSGASVTVTGALPVGIILGVTVRVTTAITGATSFDVGNGSDVDAWGATIAPTLGTTTTVANFTLATPPINAATGNVVLTANGSNFTGGVVRVTTHYLALAAAGS